MAQEGYQVAATVRNQEAKDLLLRQFPERVKVYLLDVTDISKIPQVIDEVLVDYNRIDVVVNNAGYGLVGNFEGMTLKQIRHQFEVNFFGLIEVTRAFLPHFRANKSGRFLHVSSQAGFNAGAGGSIYSASKFAVEGFSEGLGRECQHLGIYSTCIEPGPFRTDWAGRSLVLAEQRLYDYSEALNRFHDYLETANGNQKGDPEKAAVAMVTIAETGTPPTRITLGKSATALLEGKLNSWSQMRHEWIDLSNSCDFE